MSTELVDWARECGTEPTPFAPIPVLLRSASLQGKLGILHLRFSSGAQVSAHLAGVLSLSFPPYRYQSIAAVWTVAALCIEAAQSLGIFCLFSF